MLEEVNHELYTLCEDAVSGFLQTTFDSLRERFGNATKPEDLAEEGAAIRAAIENLTPAENFAVACFILEDREDVSEEGANPVPDMKEKVEWLTYLWRCEQDESEEDA